jgi:hypothetical protein
MYAFNVRLTLHKKRCCYEKSDKRIKRGEELNTRRFSKIVGNFKTNYNIVRKRKI